MKAIAQSYFWWAGLNKAIENVTRGCQACQDIQAAPAVAPLHPWVWPDAPWKQIHVDFAGPFIGKMFFIMVNAHTKWPEVVSMTSTTTQHPLKLSNRCSHTIGFWNNLVRNSPQMNLHAIYEGDQSQTYSLLSLYHPSSNGLAERFVQTFIRAMRAGEKDGLSLSQRLAEFLFSYRSTAHATTNASPSELFLQRKLRTRFDLLKPNLKGIVEAR